MKRIVWLLLVFTIGAFSADVPFIDYFPVYVYGDADSVAQVFNINAMLFQERSSGTFFWYLLVIASLILMIRAGLKINDGEWKAATREVVWLLFLLFIVLSPVATVKIIDKRFEGPYMNVSSSDSYIKVVDNVPYGLAWVAGGASVIKDYTMVFVNNIFGTTYDYSTVINRGFGKSYDDVKRILEASENLNNMRNSDASQFVVNLNSYLGECVFPTLYTTPGNREKVMNPNGSYMDTLAPLSLGLTPNDRMDSGMSCQFFWESAILPLKDQYLAHTEEVAGKIYGSDSNSTSIDAVFSNSNGMKKLFDAAAIDSIGGMKHAMREASISAAIRKTASDNAALAGFDAATAASMERSKQSMLQDGVSSFAWMQEVLPMLQHWILVLVVLLYFPMILVMIFKPVMGGVMTLLSYAGGFVLFEMTDVSFEVVQYLTNLWGGKEALEIYTASNSGQYFSVSNYASTVDYMATMSGISSFFGMISLGLINFIVLKGQVGSLASLAGTLKGAMKGDVLNSGGQEFTTDMAAREHEEAQDKMRKEKMDELIAHGYNPGSSSFETDKLYSQMQSEMKAASAGASMHHAVAEGNAGKVATASGLKAEGAMSAEIAYAEVMETQAEKQTGKSAIDVAKTSGAMAGGGAAMGEIGSVAALLREDKGMENFLEGNLRAGGAKTVSMIAKAKILDSNNQLVGTEEYWDNMKTNAIESESQSNIHGEKTAKKFGRELRGEGVTPMHPETVASDVPAVKPKETPIDEKKDEPQTPEDFRKMYFPDSMLNKDGTGLNKDTLIGAWQDAAVKDALYGEKTKISNDPKQITAEKLESAIGHTIENTNLSPEDKANAHIKKEELGRKVREGVSLSADDISKEMNKAIGNDGITYDLNKGGFGSKVLENAEKGFGVKFNDDGKIDSDKTKSETKGADAYSFIAKKARDKSEQNRNDLLDGKIDDEEYIKREEANQNIIKNAMGWDGKRLKPQMFKDAGFSQNEMDNMGLVFSTERADGYTRMFQHTSVDPDKVNNLDKDKPLNIDFSKKSEPVKPINFGSETKNDVHETPSVEPTSDNALIGKNGKGAHGRVVAYPDGTFKKGGHRNWRNNNPGNIEYGEFARKNGAIGSDGRFAIFPSMDSGFKAQAELLKSKNYDNKTMAGAVQRYAPPGENNTAAYIKAIQKDTGIHPSTPMHTLTDKQREDMVHAMAKHEGMKEGKTGNTSDLGGVKLFDASKYPGAEFGSTTASTFKGEKTSFGTSGIGASWAELNAAHEQKKIDEFTGAGSSIIRNETLDPGIYGRNAAFKEEAGARSTAADIETKGGHNAAVNYAVTEATMKAAQSKEAMEGNIKAFAKEKGMSEKETNELLKAFQNGGSAAAKLVEAGIVNAAGQLAGTMAQAKTTSDIETVKRAGGSDGYVELSKTQAAAKTVGSVQEIDSAGGAEGYIQASKVAGARKGAENFARNVMGLDHDNIDAVLDAIIDNPRISEDKKKESIASLKKAGVINKDGSRNYDAINFAEAMSTFKAGTMGDEAKVTIGNTTYDLDRDLLSHKVRINDDSHQVSSKGNGARFHNGVSGNVNQAMIEESTGFNAAQPGKNPDGSDMSPSELGVALVGGAALVGGVAYKANKSYGNPVGKAGDYVGKKIKGHIDGKDMNGKNVRFDKATWEDLKNNGFAEQGKDGKWKVTQSRDKVESYLSSAQPSSADTTPRTNAQPNTATSPTTPPSANASNTVMGTPSNLDTDSITQKTEKPFLSKEANSPLIKEDIKSQASAKRVAKEIEAMSDKDAGINKVKSDLINERANIDTSTEEGAKRAQKIDKAIASIDSGKPITSATLKAIGYNGQYSTKPNSFVNGEGKTIPFQEVDFEAVGANEKQIATKQIENFNAQNKAWKEAQKVPESTVSPSADMDGDSHKAPADVKPKSKLGKLMAAIGVLGVGASVADASVKPSVPTKTDEVVPTDGMHSADKIALGTQTVFNAANLYQATDEIKNGASSSLKTLASPKAYAEGAKDIVSDVFDTKSIKAAGTDLVEKGITAGGKQLGKAALKKLPVVGLAMGASFAVSRAQDGDYVGAAMEFASGALSMIPGIGTAASVAVDGALMARDLSKSNNDVKVPAEGKPALPTGIDNKIAQNNVMATNAQVQQMTDTGAGESFISAVTPAQNTPAMIQKSREGTLTKQDLLNNGASPEAVEGIPLTSEGNVDTAKTGAFYKKGLNAVADTIKTSQDNERYLNDNPIMSGSTAAANALIPTQPERTEEMNVSGDKVTRSVQKADDVVSTKESTTPTSQPGQPTLRTPENEEAVSRFMESLNNRTHAQTGAMTIASNIDTPNPEAVYTFAMNNGNITPAALSEMGMNPAMIEQLKSQFSTDGGKTIDMSALGEAMQNTASATFTNTKMGTSSVDNSDLLNAMNRGNGAQSNLESLMAIAEQRASSTGVPFQTSEGQMIIGRDAKDNVTVNGEATRANYQDFRESIASSSPMDQNTMASMIAGSSGADVFERLDSNDSKAWKNDGGYMLDMARDTRTGNEDARTGFMDISFALEEQTEIFQETLDNLLKNNR